jgi:hypothetical protein
MTTIVAVDPGGTTGVAIGSFSSSEIVALPFELEPMKAIDLVSEMLTRGGYGFPVASLVVYETFKPRKGVYTWQPDALYIIGAIRYLCYLSGTPCVGQEPADAKRFSTNRKLDVMGWRMPTVGGHQDDAMRHLLVAAVNGNLVDAEIFLRPEE